MNIYQISNQHKLVVFSFTEMLRVWFNKRRKGCEKNVGNKTNKK